MLNLRLEYTCGLWVSLLTTNNLERGGAVEEFAIFIMPIFSEKKDVFKGKETIENLKVGAWRLTPGPNLGFEAPTYPHS